jgi:type VI secretion system protein ImpE
MSNDTGKLLNEGRLADAIDSATRAVRADPGALGSRIILADLLLLSGNLERADKVLEAAGEPEPSAAWLVGEFRQLLRAAMIRRQVMKDGRVPEFAGEPTATQHCVLQALAELRAGDAAAAAASLQAAEDARPVLSGKANGRDFDDFRDADDVLSGSLDVLTTHGRYFWIPTERLAGLEFEPPRRPRDLAWRRCRMQLRDGTEAEVFVPALYENDSGTSDALRLGRETAWTGAHPVRGAGQRVFLAGEEDIPVQQLATVAFT